MIPSDTGPWSSEPLGPLCERLAERLGRSGASHPRAAAAVLAVRGDSRLTPAQFATRFGMSVADLVAIERGDRCPQRWPTELAVAVGAHPRLREH